MTSIFLDSNIWLRLFLKDQKDQYQTLVKLFTYINEGFIRPYTSTIVFLEVHYVLKSFYNLSHEKTLFYLEKIKETRNITIFETTDVDKTLEYYKRYKIKFTDCLIASQIPKDMILVTFDVDFRKIKEINSKTPAELNSMLKN